MDTIKAIRDRRSIRKYKPADVKEEDLETILQAGRWAPSASNKQPWHFIIIRNQEKRNNLSDIHYYGRFMKESPVVVVDGKYHDGVTPDSALELIHDLSADDGNDKKGGEK